MRFYTESYHESTQYAPRLSGDPLSLHWENEPIPDKRYPGCERIAMPRHMLPPLPAATFDGLDSINIYVVLRKYGVPDGVFYCDVARHQLVRIGAGVEMEALANSFTDSEFIRNVPMLFLYAGSVSRTVWRLKEAAYREIEKDAGAVIGNQMLFSNGRGFRTTVLGGFVDDSVANVLKLASSEIPLSALAVYPDSLNVNALSLDEGAGRFSYSNRNESLEKVYAVESAGAGSRYASRFMLQNRCECIDDLSRCIRVCRLQAQSLPGDEFPLTPAKFTNDYYYREAELLPQRPLRISPFQPYNLDLDDFSSILRWLELGQIDMFGAGLLKIWVVVFNVMFVYPGVYRYVPIQKSIYMQSSQVSDKKFARCHSAPEQAQNATFAIILTADLNECCNILGDRAYRYLNMNAGYIAESVHVSSRILNKVSHAEHFYFEKELKTLCNIPESESILSEIVVGREDS